MGIASVGRVRKGSLSSLWGSILGVRLSCLCPLRAVQFLRVWGRLAFVFVPVSLVVAPFWSFALLDVIPFVMFVSFFCSLLFQLG